MNRTIKSKNSNLWLAVIKGAILIMFGIWLLSAPRENMLKLSVLFGILIIAGGLLEVVFALNKRKKEIEWGWSMVSGVVDILLGAFMVANPSFILLLITIIISIWLLYSGILVIRFALLMKNTNPSAYRIRIIFGILLIVLAIILVWHPEIFGITVAFWAALSFIGWGILRILLEFRLNK